MFDEDEESIFKEYTINYLIDRCATCTVDEFRSFRHQLNADQLKNALACAFRCKNKPLVSYFMLKNIEAIHYLFVYSAQLNNADIIQYLMNWEAKEGKLFFRIEDICSVLAWFVQHHNIYMANLVANHYGLSTDLVIHFFPRLKDLEQRV
jgi:hypothetical protein